MKQTPADRERRKMLESSKFSAEGFLGTDTRSVEEIIAADGRVLEEADVTTGQIAARLRELYEQARDGYGREVQIGESLIAQFHESMGRVPSPFRGDGVFHKGEAVITDSRTNTTLVVTALGIALIEKHGFFQGMGSRYRIDPAAAIGVLGLGD